MKSFVVLALLPICFAVEIHFENRYGEALKKVEIPSCSAEPCALVKGQPLNVSITVQAIYPPEAQFPTVSDLESSVGIDGYRNRYIYPIAERSKYCKTEPKECPIKEKNEYTIHRQLFLSRDDSTTEHTGFGSKNGLTQFLINVVMLAHGDVGTVIADSTIVLDIKAAP